MKKRCTASACRRVFNVAMAQCPYCGKVYPGIGRLWEVALLGKDLVCSRVKAIKLCRELRGFSLREAKSLFDQAEEKAPVHLLYCESREDAQKVAEELRFYGCRIQLHPVQRTRAVVEELTESKKKQKRRRQLEAEYGRSIDELHLGLRAYNCLCRAGIVTVGELAECTPEEILSVRNMGRKALAEVIRALEERGLSLAE